MHRTSYIANLDLEVDENNKSDDNVAVNLKLFDMEMKKFLYIKVNRTGAVMGGEYSSAVKEGKYSKRTWWPHKQDYLTKSGHSSYNLTELAGNKNKLTLLSNLTQ